MSGRRLHWVGPLALFVVLAMLLAPSAATGEGVFGYHDFRHHHLPWRSWAAGRWSAGEVPWWAPGAANGFPLLAEGQGGFLYLPTMLLFVLLPDGPALNWAVLGHHVLAAMGMWALVSRLGLRGAAPLASGIIYGFSGFLVSHSLYLGMQNGLAWLPWCLYATVARQGWLTALGLGAMGLAGHPQAAVFGGLLVAWHAIWTLERGERLRWLGWTAGGALIAAPQAVASLELSQFSMRDGGVDAAFAGIGAMPLPEILGLVLPYAFGFDRPADVAETYYHRGLGYWGAGVNSWEMCVYAGVPALILAMAGARRSRFWTVTALVATLLMFGGPLWDLLRMLPGLGYFRFPVRFALVQVTAIAVLAGYGLDELRRGDPRALRRRILWTVVLFTLSTGVVRLGLQTRTAEIAGALWGHFESQVGPLPEPPELSALAKAALPPPEPEVAAEIPAKVARIFADLVRSSDPRSPRVWVPVFLLVATALLARRPRLLAALVAVDLLAFGRGYHPTLLAEELLDAPRWLSARMTSPGGWRTTVLDRRVPVELDDELLTANRGLPLGTSDIIIPSPLLILRNEAFLASVGLDVGDKGPDKVRRFLARHDLSRRLSVRFIASIHELPGLLPLVRGGWNLFDDPSALPRARVLPCAERVEGADAAYAVVLEADPERTVVVEGGEGGCLGEVMREASIDEYRDERVEITAAGPGWLVLADTWYPGWTATVDGAVEPIERADLVMRAVRLGEGDHTVVFEYDPGKLSWLLGLSGLVTVGCVAVGVWPKRPSTRP